MRGFVNGLIRISVAAVFVATLIAGGLVVYARSQGLLILIVQTASMRPAIRPGDAVLVRQTPPAITGIKVGDVISYYSLENPEVIITHRVVAIDYARGMLTLRGDASRVNDEPIPLSRVVGINQQTIPLLGYVFDFMRQPLGLALAVYVPAMVIIIWEIRRLMKYYDGQRYVLYYY